MGTLNKKRILILHGWTYSLDKWEFFADLLKKTGFDVEILQIPGLTSESDEAWDLEKYSVWLGGKIGNSQVIILGHSNGGRIAAYFASRHPENVAKLILIDSAGIYHKEMYIQIKRFVFGTAAKLGKKITGAEVLRRFLYRLAGESDYQKATPNMKQSMINLINSDLREDYKRITTETVIVWGRDDKVTPLSDAILINKLIRKSKLEVIDDAKHSPFFTHPELVIKVLKKYLK